MDTSEGVSELARRALAPDDHRGIIVNGKAKHEELFAVCMGGRRNRKANLAHLFWRYVNYSRSNIGIEMPPTKK